MRRNLLPWRILPLAPAGPVLAGVLAGALATIGAQGITAQGATRPNVAAPGPAPITAPLSAVALIGRRMFTDTALSASGRLSCASCHDPRDHYAPDNASPVQPGGPALHRFGRRAVPTLTYKSLTPGFTIGPENPALELNEASPLAVAERGHAARGVTTLDPADPAPAPRKTAGTTTLTAPVPRGGMFWDGRVDTLEEQAEGPLFTHFEMADTPATLARTLRTRYGAQLAAIFGAQVLHDERMLISEAAFALARYQMEDPSFHPYSSKFDAWLDGKAKLTPAEAEGLKLFNAPKKGNCAACHLDLVSKDGRHPLFTDFEYEALGVPRNPKIPANADPRYYDLGLCGPLRKDAVSRRARYCGLFKTPTLRNVATRHVFFHNGVYRSLAQVLTFYAERDSNPSAIYPQGVPNDLPPRFRANIDHIDAPFGRSPGAGPALTRPEQADIIAFLKTLTDGWHPGEAPGVRSVHIPARDRTK